MGAFEIQETFILKRENVLSLLIVRKKVERPDFEMCCVIMLITYIMSVGWERGVEKRK